MLLSGSCHCGTVSFTVESRTPYPYLRCYCSICRKTMGGGGYAINIMGEAPTLQVRGREYVRVYQAVIDDGAGHVTRSPGRRHFCGDCGSGLWVDDPRWPDWVYPFASAIDTPLPKPPQVQHMMLDFAAPWVDVPSDPGDSHFAQYPDEAIADWHAKRGLGEPPVG